MTQGRIIADLAPLTFGSPVAHVYNPVGRWRCGP
jgi:hypothetical protein